MASVVLCCTYIQYYLIVLFHYTSNTPIRATIINILVDLSMCTIRYKYEVDVVVVAEVVLFFHHLVSVGN